MKKSYTFVQHSKLLIFARKVRQPFNKFSNEQLSNDLKRVPYGSSLVRFNISERQLS